MLIIVSRYLATNTATLSKITVDGVFMGYGLEDEQRAVKVPGETRIPAGAYKVKLRDYGGWHKRLAQADWIKDIHIGMLEIKDVPEFSDILIHPGNDEGDTAGCLLIGERADELKMTVSNSRFAYRRLYASVKDAAKAGTLRIDIQDNDK